MNVGRLRLPNSTKYFSLCYNEGMHGEIEPPLIVGFLSDLMFAVKIEDVATRLNYRVEWVEDAAQFAAQFAAQYAGESAPVETADALPARQLGEHLTGPGAALLDRLTRQRPALILFDLGNSRIPWREWLPLIKSVPATRRIPVVCFGSHVDVAAFQEARSRGADAVLARSRFMSDLPNLIQKYARVPDYVALAAACEEPLSVQAVRGLDLFNRGEYFEAHELLEEAWNHDTSAGRELYRAILQVAVAYLQIERGNYNGAMKMFLRVRQWIDPLPERCRGIELGKLRDEARLVHARLEALGPERIGELDRRMMKPVVYTTHGGNTR